MEVKRKKTGGRKKGTPNKSTLLCKDTIISLLSDYEKSGLMNKDFKELEPRDRLMFAEKIMQYVLPKCQAVAVDVKASDEHTQSIEERLLDLAK